MNSALCEQPRYVAGVLGPTNRTASLSPDVNDPGARNVSFEALASDYRDAAAALLEGGADLVLLETIFDTLNAKAAIFALLGLQRELGRHIPADDFRNHHRCQRADPVRPDLRGVLVLTAAMRPPCRSDSTARSVLSSCVPTWSAWVGSLMSRSACTRMPVCRMNSAGTTSHPRRWRPILGEFADDGLLNIVGGCCGTTPEHIAAVRERVRSCPPRKPREPAARLCPERSRAVQPGY